MARILGLVVAVAAAASLASAFPDIVRYIKMRRM